MLRSRKSELFAGLLVMGAVLASPAVALTQDDVPAFGHEDVAALTRCVDHVLERLA